MYFEKMMEQHERKTEHVLSMQGRGLGPADQFDSLEAELRANLVNAGLNEIIEARDAYYTSVNGN